MNILPKKSWHVRNKDNVARVRRDEAAALEAEIQRSKKADLAEAEVTISRLRKDSASLITKKRQSEGHINLFNDRNYDNTLLGQANIKEKEAKEEQKEWEMKVGLLTGLGKSSDYAAPWYAKDTFTNPTIAEQKAKRRDDSRKQHLDPALKFKALEEKKSADSRVYSSSYSYHSSERKRHSRKKKHKSKKKRKVSTSSSTSSSENGDGESDLDKLRKERLLREAAERERSERLIAGLNPSPTSKSPTQTSARYNSQFNPHFAKR